MRKALPILFLLLISLGLAPPMAEEDMLVPVDLQLTIFAKVLRFDRALLEREGDELVLGVLFQERVRESDVVKDLVVEKVRESRLSIQDRPIRTVPLTAANPDELAAAIKRHGIHLLYVGPVRAFNAERYARVTRQNSVITLTGVPQFVEDGLSIGVGLAGDRPEIIINVEAAREEGANLQARLLQLARIVQN